VPGGCPRSAVMLRPAGGVLRRRHEPAGHRSLAGRRWLSGQRQSLPDACGSLPPPAPDQTRWGGAAPLGFSRRSLVLDRDVNGAVTVLEVEAIESIAPLRNLDIEVGGMLSEHDLELVSRLKPGMPGVVLVTG